MCRYGCIQASLTFLTMADIKLSANNISKLINALADLLPRNRCSMSAMKSVGPILLCFKVHEVSTSAGYIQRSEKVYRILPMRLIGGSRFFHQGGQGGAEKPDRGASSVTKLCRN